MNKKLFTYITCIIGFAALGGMFMALIANISDSITPHQIHIGLLYFTLFGAALGAFLGWALNILLHSD